MPATNLNSSGQIEAPFIESKDPFLWNKDLEPTPIDKRGWGAYTYAAIWFGMAFVVPSWGIVSLGIVLGLNMSTVLVLDFLGSCIVLVPMIIQAHGGAKYGMAETQLTRTRWGIFGAWVPSWVRAIISMGWWSIVSFIITEAITGVYIVISGNFGPLNALISKGSVGPATIAQAYPVTFYTTFAIVVVAQIGLFYISPPRNTQPVLKWFARIMAPLIFVAFLVIWLTMMKHVSFDITPIFTIKATAHGIGYITSSIIFINAIIADWATMIMSMPDFTRFSKSQKAQIYGQVSMPFYMLIVGFFGATTTAATILLYHTQIWDPILVATLHLPKGLAIFALVLIALSSFTVNAFANTIAPGYDIANTYPKKLTWFRGVVIGIIISFSLGIVTYYGNAYSFLYSWLLKYGVFLGAVEGVLIFDYAIIRRFKFRPIEVFKRKGDFTYLLGVNPAAIIAFLVAILLVYVDWSPVQAYLYDGSWISTFLISGFLYLALMKYWVIPKYQPFLKGSIIHGYKEIIDTK